MTDDNEQVRQRRAKLDALREAGPAFPNDFRRTMWARELHERYGELSAEQLEQASEPSADGLPGSESETISVAGRMTSRRVMGKASFAHLEDGSGESIQLYVRRDDLPEGIYNQHFKKWDIGDIVGARGQAFRTNKGELSLKVEDMRLLTKALRPMPEKFHGLADQETKYRQRYLDLISNRESREVFRRRSQIVTAIREFFVERDFLEVETPMMHPIAGGAAARPFETYHNALGMPLYLRIAPELYLKRLVVGGFERVFEINRNFRNEGLSTQHNPEFTMLEFYQAYADYEELMDLTETLVRRLARQVVGSTNVPYQGEVFDLESPFARLTMFDAVLAHNPGVDRAELKDPQGIRRIAQALGAKLEPDYGPGKVLTEIFEHTVEAKLRNPTFITAYPTEVSPLARRNDDNPEVTDRFEFFIGGREIANGFSELNDAEDQAERFHAQVASRDAGDEEAMRYDEDYVTALEYGMPPTAGEGVGIDRLVMLLTDSASIRDVILFPHMRPVG